MSIQAFVIQVEYDNFMFEVEGEFEPEEPMTWQGFHWEPGHRAVVGIESVCVVGSNANLINALSESCLEYLKKQVEEQMAEVA